MRFSKQKKSLDRKIFPLRKKYNFLNRLYNHFSEINIEHSFHSQAFKNTAIKKAQHSLDSLLEPTNAPNESKDIPKIIWIFWDSGFDNAPDVVKLSAESWKKLNPNYEVKLLDDDNLEQHLGFDFHAMYQLSSIRCLPPTKADLLRLHLLSKHGGIWTDATTFCLKPLDEWLPEASIECNLFTFVHRINPTRPIEAWFIASPKGSRIISDTLKNFVHYIFEKRKTSLFISGKVPLLEKVASKEEMKKPLEPNINKRAEEYGFMPYFSIGYFFYSALKKHLSEKQLDIFLRKGNNSMTNQHALTKDDFLIFKDSVVSKQTYINSYINSATFKERKDFIIEKFKNIN